MGDGQDNPKRFARQDFRRPKFHLLVMGTTASLPIQLSVGIAIRK